MPRYEIYATDADAAMIAAIASHEYTATGTEPSRSEIIRRAVADYASRLPIAKVDPLPAIAASLRHMADTLDAEATYAR
jgi:hypothetical protein